MEEAAEGMYNNKTGSAAGANINATTSGMPEKLRHLIHDYRPGKKRRTEQIVDEYLEKLEHSYEAVLQRLAAYPSARSS